MILINNEGPVNSESVSKNAEALCYCLVHFLTIDPVLDFDRSVKGGS